MIKNYFKIAIRNIVRNGTGSVLNITGIAIGMAATLLILLWVQDEWSYDRYLENAGDLYRLIQKDTSSTGHNMMVPVPAALGNTLKAEYPEIIRSSRYASSPLTLKKGEQFIEESVAVVDKDFLQMFEPELVQGDLKKALDDPHNIILTEEMEKKYFGNVHALGKTIQSRGYDVKVTGVIKNWPKNSHLKIDFLVPVEWLRELGARIDEWDHSFHTYIELSKETDSRILENKINGILRSHKPESRSVILLQNVKKIHLYSSGKYAYDVSGHGDIIYVRILGIIAVFILMIACINFMNLSSAQLFRRSKEAGIRKVSGASRQIIIWQFIGESFLLVFVAHIIAMILVELFMPGFNKLTTKHLVLDYGNPVLYLGLVTIIILCSVLAGIYPALYLSSLKPLDVIKGINNNKPASVKLRKALVIFQFTMSVVLIISTLIIGHQLKYLQNKDLGYNRDNVGYFMFPIRPGDPKLESLKKELGKCPGITGITKGFNPVNIEGSIKGFSWTGKKEGTDAYFCFAGADADFASTFEFRIKQGRFFSPEIASDSFAVVINESAADILGFRNPLGEVLTTPWGARLTIIGIMNNFHFKSLHHTIEPLLLVIGASNNIYLRMKPEHISSTVESINKIFKSFDPGLPLDFHFLDQDFKNLYKTELRISRIFTSFSFLAIFISILGLFGLSFFMTERRTKEIGIRKTNGATSFEIFSLLTGEYLKWILAAILIASPIAWYAMKLWLHNFAYRVTIASWTFELAGAIALVVAFLTVSMQSFRAAGKNSVDALRYE